MNDPLESMDLRLAAKNARPSEATSLFFFPSSTVNTYVMLKTSFHFDFKFAYIRFFLHLK